MRPQIISGNPPDIVMVDYSFFDYFGAIQEGAFTELDKYLDLTIEGEDITIKDKLRSDIVDAVRVNGKAYILPDNMSMYGIFYNKTLFDEKGWAIPASWDEFMALCETIKTTEKGIAPFIYPGMYSYYFERSFFWPCVAALGNGQETIKNLNNLKAGFWKSEPVMETAKRVETMRDKGYFFKNFISLNHTQSQMEFINGRAAMIGNGTWLDNEMAGNWPDSFRLMYMPAPVTRNTSDSKFIYTGGNFFGLPSAAMNKDYIGEFLKIFYSENNRVKIAKENGMLTPVENILKGISDIVSPSINSALKASETNNLFVTTYNLWYSELHETFQNNLTALVSGSINAEEFCTRMEKAADDVRNNSSIVKYKVG